jgi:N-methylhydantoinase A
MNRARDAFAGLAGELGESIDQTAHGILRIASGSMINSVKIISVQRGHDPRDFALVAMGGAGPLHAGHVARELHISKVIVPVAPAHFSATGMLNSDLRRDYVRTHVLRTDRQMTGQIEALFGELETQAEREHSQEGSPGQLRLSRETDMRYRGQEHTVHVQCGPGTLDDQGLHLLEDKFHENHDKRYSFRLDSPIEIVNFHLVAWGIMPKPVRKPLNRIKSIARPIGTRAVWFEDEGRRTVPVYRRNELASGTRIRGPAVVEEVATVTLVYPDAELAVHELGDLIIESRA